MNDFRSIIGITALGAAFLLPAQIGLCEERHAIIQVSAVLASKDRRELDPRIDPKLRRELRPLPFKGYMLLGVDACRFQTGDQCAMEIPGDGYLQIQTTEANEHYVKMKLLLVQGNRPILNAEVKLNRNASLLLKSASTGMGTILLSIKAPEIGGAEVETASNADK